MCISKDYLPTAVYVKFSFTGSWVASGENLVLMLGPEIVWIYKAGVFGQGHWQAA